jgi:hypothetical protein
MILCILGPKDVIDDQMADGYHSLDLKIEKYNID